MKINKILIISISLLLAAIFVLTSCSGDDVYTEAVYYTVTFDSSGGTPVEAKKIKEGATFIEPAAPEKSGFIFDGWYHNGAEWDFAASTVKGDITLKAVWLAPTAVFTHAPTGDGNTAITGYKKLTSNLTVPSAIEGYAVTSIADNAFENITVADEKITITIPECVNTIGVEAFYGSSSVEIIVEGALTSVGEAAFYGCAGLRSVKFGDGITKISAEAFVGCASLKSVHIPKTVKVIEENAFDDCVSLETVLIYPDLETIEDQAFFGTDLQVIYFCGTETEADTFFADGAVIQGQNPQIKGADILIYSEEEPSDKTNSYDGYWYMEENGSIRKWD